MRFFKSPANPIFISVGDDDPPRCDGGDKIFTLTPTSAHVKHFPGPGKGSRTGRRSFFSFNKPGRIRSKSASNSQVQPVGYADQFVSSAAMTSANDHSFPSDPPYKWAPQDRFWERYGSPQRRRLGSHRLSQSDGKIILARNQKDSFRGFLEISTDRNAPDQEPGQQGNGSSSSARSIKHQGPKQIATHESYQRRPYFLENTSDNIQSRYELLGTGSGPSVQQQLLTHGNHVTGIGSETLNPKQVTALGTFGFNLQDEYALSRSQNCKDQYDANNKNNCDNHTAKAASQKIYMFYGSTTDLLPPIRPTTPLREDIEHDLNTLHRLSVGNTRSHHLSASRNTMWPKAGSKFKLAKIAIGANGAETDDGEKNQQQHHHHHQQSYSDESQKLKLTSVTSDMVSSPKIYNHPTGHSRGLSAQVQTRFQPQDKTSPRQTPSTGKISNYKHQQHSSLDSILPPPVRHENHYISKTELTKLQKDARLAQKGIKASREVPPPEPSKSGIPSRRKGSSGSAGSIRRDQLPATPPRNSVLLPESPPELQRGSFVSPETSPDLKYHREDADWSFGPPPDMMEANSTGTRMKSFYDWDDISANLDKIQASFNSWDQEHLRQEIEEMLTTPQVMVGPTSDTSPGSSIAF